MHTAFISCQPPWGKDPWVALDWKWSHAPLSSPHKVKKGEAGKDEEILWGGRGGGLCVRVFIHGFWECVCVYGGASWEAPDELGSGVSLLLSKLKHVVDLIVIYQSGPSFINELVLCRFWSISAEWENMLFSLRCVKNTEEGVDADTIKNRLTLHNCCTFLKNEAHVVCSYRYLRVHHFCLTELLKLWNRKNICYLDR